MNKKTPQSQGEYHVSRGDITLGPWTIEEIAQKLGSAEISATDFIYEDAKSDWIPLMECAALKELLNRSKPKAPPPSREKLKVIEAQTQTEVSSQAVAEWYVLKGANRYGPLTYLGVLHALQEKTVHDFDFIWNAGMETWMRIADHAEFQPDLIRKLVSKADHDESVFFSRKHPRVSYDCEVIVNDGRNAWLARTYEASPGGTGLTIQNPALMPGQILHLHFSSTEQLPAFNALCEIVGKQFSKEARGKKAAVKYAVRFVQFFASQDGGQEKAQASSQAVEQRVQNYFKAAA